MWTAVIAGAAAGLASVPHCTAMCGPLAAYACSGRPGASGPGRYQLGRFVSYSMLGGIAGSAEHRGVHLVDCRGALPDVADWADEIHGTSAGFAKVADRFRATLANVLA